MAFRSPGWAVGGMIAVASWLAMETVAVAQAPPRLPEDDSAHDFEIASTVSLDGIAGSSTQILSDLGTLPAGHRGIATITITNPHDEPIPIASVRVGCSCARARLKGNVIPAGGQAELEVMLGVPGRGGSAKFDAGVELQVDRQRATIPLRSVSLRMRFSATGMLSFPERSVVLAVYPDRPRTVSIPFVSTVEIPADQLEISATGFLAGASGKVIPDAPLNRIELTLMPEDATPEGSHGTVTLSAGDGGPSDKVHVVLFLENTLQISPRTLRFRPGDQGLEASAVLHAIRPTESKGDDNTGQTLPEEGGPAERPEMIFFEAFVRDRRLTVEAQRLSRLILRLKVRFDGDAEELESLTGDSATGREIIWNVMIGSEKHRIRSHFSIGK